MPNSWWTTARFRPLRPVSRGRMIAAFVIGPLLWVIALCLVAWLVDRSDAIELGLAIAAASFLAGILSLSMLRGLRAREERRYARGR